MKTQAGERRMQEQSDSGALVGQGERGPSPDRLRGIALNRLKSLGVPAWVAHGWARGRLMINPDRYKSYSGVRLTPEQDFVVYQHAFLAFPVPSPLSHLGGIRFYDEESLQSLLVSIERRWTALIAGTEAALLRARAFAPDAKLDPTSWMIETVVEDRIGRVVFRFDGRLAILFAYSVGGVVLTYGPGSPPIAIQLPAEPLPIDGAVLAPYVRAARARLGVEVEREDTGRISLDLSPPSTDLASLVVEDHGAVIGRVVSRAVSEDLDFDLEALKTGDLKIYPQHAPPSQPAPKLDTGHSARKHRREPQNVPAKLTWDGGSVDVVLADISAGGAFARSSSSRLPRGGEHVRLSGFGKLMVSGQVAFVRPVEEAHLFATGSGIGISFMIEPLAGGLRKHQEAPACAIFLLDPESRRRALIAIDEARALPWTADSLVDLVVITLHMDIKLVVLEQQMLERVEAALGLTDRGITVLALRGPSDHIDAARIRKELQAR